MPKKLTLTPTRLCLLLSAWIVLTGNTAFWALLFRVQGTGPSGWPFVLSLFFALVGLHLLLFRLLSPGRLLRPMLTLLLFLASTAGWFMDTYGVALDSGMLRNVVQTNAAEAREFFGWSLVWRWLWQAVPPIVLVWWMPLLPQGWWRATRDWVLGSVAGLVLLLVAALPMFSSYASYFRNQKEARYLITPANVVVGSVRLVRKSMAVPGPFEQVGLDAKRLAVPGARPLLIVLVVGETARAANFSLGGYARETNPLLAKRELFYYRDATSCGTSTATSLPCMFSEQTREEFEPGKAVRRDSVLDILQRSGLAVRWIDNQSGCKQICARVEREQAEIYHPTSCEGGECLDDTLLYALDARLPATTTDSVLVLHTLGSHGPGYFRRVPPEFRKFQPICATERIETCSDAAIVNTYDNSILYTDHVVDGLIERLAAQSQTIDSVLLYVSDHGESLGEKGLYLHGQPWLMAPAVQKEIPIFMWFSTGTPQRLGLDTSCLRASLGAAVSHDNLAHTLLGLGDVSTSVYRSSLDLLANCRPRSAAAQPGSQ
jgi:lipid A ethanolaminephosphotransferase